MNIIPIGSYPVQTSSVPGAAKTTDAAGSAFKDVFNDALGNLQELNATKNQDTLNLAAGDVDDLVAIASNGEKADIALRMLVEMRNKLLDGYQEIMRINV